MSKPSEINMTDKRSVGSLWSAADVWIKKPHVVNKRLCGVTETESRDVDTAELKQVLSCLLGTNIEMTDIYVFLHADVVVEDHEIAGRWCVGVRTIIPKVNKTGDCRYKDVVIKGERQHGINLLDILSFLMIFKKNVSSFLDMVGNAVTFIPFEVNGVGQVTLKSSNIYQIQLQLKPDEW